MDSEFSGIAKTDLRLMEQQINEHLNFLARNGVEPQQLAQLAELYQSAHRLNKQVIQRCRVH